jgi:hypothetical protein
MAVFTLYRYFCKGVSPTPRPLHSSYTTRPVTRLLDYKTSNTSCPNKTMLIITELV